MLEAHDAMSLAMEEQENGSGILEGQDLVYFSPGPWDGLWRNRHQLMSKLAAAGNRVLFVEPRLSLSRTLEKAAELARKPAEMMRPALREAKPNLWVLRYPIWAPHSKRLGIDRWTRHIRRAQLRRALARIGMDGPIVWFSLPSMFDLLGEIPEARLKIYHVVDEYSAYGDRPPEVQRKIEETERRILSGVDLVIVVSRKLYETKSPLHRKTHLVPNGVDFEHFSKVLKALENTGLPRSLEAIPRPRIGYSGLIGDKLDLGLLEELAKRHPEWSFVFVGKLRIVRQARVWQSLRRLPNVHYLGEVSGDRVPHYLNGLDAGILPYRVTRHSENISPLKLYDYLAVGLPVVSTDIPAVREFSREVRIASDPDGFSGALEKALASDSLDARSARRGVAARNSWDRRVRVISKICRDQMAERVS